MMHIILSDHSQTIPTNKRYFNVQQCESSIYFIEMGTYSKLETTVTLTNFRWMSFDYVIKLNKNFEAPSIKLNSQ